MPMRLSVYVVIWCLSGYLPIAQATHQVGGHLEMRPLGTSPGRYKIIVTNYLENNARGNQQTGGRLGIFRKRDNVLMMTFNTSESGTRKPIVYANERCAQQRNLNFIVATFEADITLDPANYADSQGYYISYQTRNRNGGIDNILNPLNTGYTFYLEFPPLIRNGQPFLNGSPSFPNVNGEYICLNEPFSFAFGGTDPDGDELRYSLVTPLNQLGTGNTNNAVLPGPYPSVQWASGFSAANAVPGNPALQVNSSTGELTVTASRQGLFVFAVKVEEYRDGQLIGEVRRDFQFLVVDCPPVTQPKALAQALNHPASATSFTICPETNITIISTNVDPSWYYQWQRNGINLPGDTLPTLRASEQGTYEVVVSSKVSCVKASKSQSMTLTIVDLTARLASSGHLCATTGTLSLSVNEQANQTYQWFVNNQLQSGATLPVFTTQQPGRFQVEVTNTVYNCRLRSDTWTIERSAAVQATIGASQSAICPEASLTLEGSGGLSYRWQHNNLPQTGSSATFEVKTAGTYSLTAIDQYGCEGVSQPLVIGQVPPITVSFEPVPPVCGTANPAVSLKGMPLGGEFAGTGVTATDLVPTQFNPMVAGIGDHALTYTVRPAPWCAGVVAQQTAIVAPVPTVVLPDTIRTWKGNSFTIDPVLTGNPTQFLWRPSSFLVNSNTASLDVVNITKDTTYYFIAQNTAGCEVRDTVRVLISTQIWVPDAFTPNFDGKNDAWELKGVEGFTIAEVTVFNRWGEVVYWSNNGYKTPFDGSLKGKPLPGGPYAYVIRPAPGYDTIRGRVLLLR